MWPTSAGRRKLVCVLKEEENDCQIEWKKSCFAERWVVWIVCYSFILKFKNLENVFGSFHLGKTEQKVLQQKNRFCKGLSLFWTCPSHKMVLWQTFRCTISRQRVDQNSPEVYIDWADSQIVSKERGAQIGVTPMLMRGRIDQYSTRTGFCESVGESARRQLLMRVRGRLKRERPVGSAGGRLPSITFWSITFLSSVGSVCSAEKEGQKRTWQR